MASEDQKIIRHAKWKAEAERLAKNKKGKCLVLPKRAHDYGTWKCSIEEHPEWKAPLVQIRGTKNKKGSWCPHCAPNARVSFDIQRAWATRFSGKLIKPAQRTTLRAWWNCKEHGQFQRAFNSMKNSDTFCPDCSRSLGERKCKAAVEQLFEKKFVKKRFADLRGVGGNPLEIDIYNEELRLGIEHHGAQHYLRKKFFGLSRYSKQQEHDKRRRKYCKAQGITLIEIRQVGEVTPDEELKAIIVNACIREGIKLPRNYSKKSLNLDPASLATNEGVMWARTKEEAKKRGWKIVSKKYLGVLTRHEFVCENNHRVLKKPMGLFAGEGCLICNKLRPVVFEDGRLFESSTEAARALNTTVSHISFAVRNNGRTQGLRVAQISHLQLAEFHQKQKLIGAFWKKQPPAKMVGSLGKPVLLSDGRAFSSIAGAARALGVEGKNLFATYNSLKRDSVLAGIKVIKIG